MKKQILSGLLALVLVVSIVACKQDTKPGPQPTPQPQAKTYTVNFYANYDDGPTDPIMTQTFTEGVRQKLKKNTHKYSLYKFLGWAEEKNSDHETYKNEEETTIDKDTNLYAIWKAATKTIKYTGQTSIPGDHGTPIIVTTSLTFYDNGEVVMEAARPGSTNKNTISYSGDPRTTGSVKMTGSINGNRLDLKGIITKASKTDPLKMELYQVKGETETKMMDLTENSH